jgi:hypothetical protein
MFVDLLLGESAASGGPTAHDGTTGRQPAGRVAVAVTVPVQSLLDLDNTPGQISGDGGPVPARVARDLLTLPDILVYRLLTDPVGNLLDVTQLGRFPTAKLGFAVEARDQTCLIPTCNRPAVLCDLDHTNPHPRGPTAYANLGPLCRRHHR